MRDGNFEDAQSQKKSGKKPLLFKASLSEFERSDDRSVTLDILRLEIVEKPSAATDHLQQPAPRMIVVLVLLEVLVEVIDALGKKRDLYRCPLRERRTWR